MECSYVVKLTCLLLLCMLVGAPTGQAYVSCGEISYSLTPCHAYVTGRGPLNPACCNGVRKVKNAVRTTADRQQACYCLKQGASRLQGINYRLANSLPGRCGVRMPYLFSPNINCARIG